MKLEDLKVALQTAINDKLEREEKLRKKFSYYASAVKNLSYQNANFTDYQIINNVLVPKGKITWENLIIFESELSAWLQEKIKEIKEAPLEIWNVL